MKTTIELLKAAVETYNITKDEALQEIDMALDDLYEVREDINIELINDELYQELFESFELTHSKRGHTHD